MVPVVTKTRLDPARSPVRTVFVLVLGALLVLGLSLGTAPSPAAAASDACTLPQPSSRLLRGSLRLPPHPKVLVLGDSYTDGWGAEPRSNGWAHLIGGPLGWSTTLRGVVGTGYVNRGPHDEGTYLERLPALRWRSFDLVVLQGGSNDRGTAYPVLRKAVFRTVEAVQRQFPRAQVVILGPATPYGSPGADSLLMECVLAGTAASQHVGFMDPIGEQWFVRGDGARYANPKNGHPNNAGYAHIAARFEADAHVLLGPRRRGAR